MALIRRTEGIHLVPRLIEEAGAQAALDDLAVQINEAFIRLQEHLPTLVTAGGPDTSFEVTVGVAGEVTLGTIEIPRKGPLLLVAAGVWTDDANGTTAEVLLRENDLAGAIVARSKLIVQTAATTANRSAAWSLVVAPEEPAAAYHLGVKGTASATDAKVESWSLVGIVW